MKNEYLKSLKEKHKELDSKIKQVYIEDISGQENITILKRKKLKIKDKITHLEKDTKSNG